MNGSILVCFAVPQEARPLQRLLRGRRDVHVRITGMGARQAEKAVRSAFEEGLPTRVFSSGFAGAIDPTLHVGEVVFDADTTLLPVREALERCGAKPAKFHCAGAVASTAAEKSALRLRTGANVVEMESKFIRDVCEARGIECVTVRAISDAADENLPLDFNAVMTVDQKLSPTRLALALLRSPQRIPGLLCLGRNSARAARNLAHVLYRVIAEQDESS